MLGRWRRLLPKPWRPRVERIASSAPTLAPARTIEGSERGWLRVLSADELLHSLRADEALQAIWRQTRVAASAWQRDLLPAIQRHAELVQLMPASESHHHAHAGGLLAHTLEMLLAAVTWRNGHLLPAGAAIEQIDAERDVWTYAVFHAALLHDIAKPLTDLRILWRAAGMPEPLRWTPLAGSLAQLAQGRARAEYRVEFTPKPLRDYGAHSRLALTLLAQVAPQTALSFMARTPQAMDALTQYLCGQDKSSLMARIVSRADQASTRKSLASGTRARFETATSVPLIELLMGALKQMLQSGSALPLNRSGAAGWVHGGSLWLVAKRVADATRAWLHEHAPEESVPGDSKNDRLFDTWQEYGCIEPNPQTGQAVWYVVVHGKATLDEADEGEGATYSHSLTMLRFPLARLYDDPTQYPPPMNGHVEVKERRQSRNDQNEAPAAQGVDEAESGHPSGGSVTRGRREQDATTPRVNQSSIEAEQGPTETGADSASSSTRSKMDAPKPLRAPGFNKPKSAAAQASTLTPTPAAAPARAANAARPAPSPLAEGIQIANSVDGFEVEDGWLGANDDVRAATRVKPKAAKLPSRKPTPMSAPGSTKAAAAASNQTAGNQRDKLDTRRAGEVKSGDPAEPAVTARLIRACEPQSSAAARTTPIVLQPQLPELPQDAAARRAEPSATALAFIRWLQQGLASRAIKYNESGAAVHFTAEGMALVSPLIFKLYASQIAPQDDADITGLQVQREVLKAGWHLMVAGKGSGKVNIVSYAVLGKGSVSVGKLSAVVLTEPDRFVLPVPPVNGVLVLIAH